MNLFLFSRLGVPFMSYADVAENAFATSSNRRLKVRTVTSLPVNMLIIWLSFTGIKFIIAQNNIGTNGGKR
jgi:hypothetical protein